MAVTPDNILKYCLDNLEGVVEVRSWGERGIFYNPSSVLKRGVYVLTIKEKDGDNDRASQLDREGAWQSKYRCPKTDIPHFVRRITQTSMQR